MKPRWIIAGAAALALALLTLPMLRENRGGGEAIRRGRRDGRSRERRLLRPDRQEHVRLRAEGRVQPAGQARRVQGQGRHRQFLGDVVRPVQDGDPRLREALREYKDKGLVIVGISIDDSPEQLQAFMREFKMNYPVVQMRPEVEDAWGPFYGYPTSFIVARDGSICTKHIGPATHAQFEAEIKALLVSIGPVVQSRHAKRVHTRASRLRLPPVVPRRRRRQPRHRCRRAKAPGCTMSIHVSGSAPLRLPRSAPSPDARAPPARRRIRRRELEASTSDIRYPMSDVYLSNPSQGRTGRRVDRCAR